MVCFEFRDSYFVLPRPLVVGKSYDFQHHIILPFLDAQLMGRGTRGWAIKEKNDNINPVDYQNCGSPGKI